MEKVIVSRVLDCGKKVELIEVDGEFFVEVRHSGAFSELGIFATLSDAMDQFNLKVGNPKFEMTAEKLDMYWHDFLDFYCSADLDEAIRQMNLDCVWFKITDKRVEKLLRLSACPAAKAGEKHNAAKMAYKFISELINNTKEVA